MIDKTVFYSNNRYLSNDDILSVVEDLENDKTYSNLVDMFFDNVNSSFPRTGILRISGSKPSLGHNYLYDSLNGAIIQNVPYMVAMAYCADFLELYDGNLQDRSHFVSINQLISVSDYTVALFIILLTYRSSFSLFTPELSFIDGTLSLKFEFSVNAPEIRNITENIIYDFLFNKLKIQDAKLTEALFNELVIHKDGKIITVSKTFYSRKRNDKKLRILGYIELMGEASALEIADYFSISKRTANYILKELEESSQIEKTGKPNDSHLKYRRL